MKLLHVVFLFLGFVCFASLSAELAHPLIGGTKEAVVERFGMPTNSLSSSTKTILNYPQGRITLKQGRVADVSGEFEFDTSKPPSLKDTTTSTQSVAPPSRTVEAPAPGAQKPVASKKETPTSFRWSVMLADAQRRSEASGLPILVLFTGPDWCPPCIQLEEEVLPRKEFQNYVRSNFIPLKVALFRRSPQSPASKAQYESMVAQYGVNGVPSFIIISADGTLLGEPDIWKQYSGAKDREQQIIAALQAADGGSAGAKSYLKIALGLVLVVVLIRAIRK
ncbi:MAG: thioredoxin family protein [Coraliomargarita sp.]